MTMNLTSDLAKAITEHRARYVYTYPFKGAYRPLAASISAVEDWANSGGPLNVYIHVPFCDMKCGFCFLFTTVQHTPTSVKIYADAVRREIKLVTENRRFSEYQVKSVYFGGGTPTVMSPSTLDSIVRELQNRLPHGSDCELAIESAPGRATPAQLGQLRKTGFRRISLGVQSFVDEELAAMRRHHTAADALKSIAEAHQAGFKNVNVDLIYGLSGQSLSAWQRSLSAAVSGLPETITIYPLTFRSRTPFGKSFKADGDRFPSPTERDELYEFARHFLFSKGYRQLTMVAFARDGGGNFHEQNEFLGIPTVGFGAGALSYGPNYHYTSGHYHDKTPNTIAISQYMTAVQSGELPIQAGIFLDREEHMRRHLVMRLLSVGVQPAEFANRFGIRPEVEFSGLFGLLREHGLLAIGPEHIHLTPKGIRSSGLVADLLASERVGTAAASYD